MPNRYFIMRVDAFSTTTSREQSLQVPAAQLSAPVITALRVPPPSDPQLQPHEPTHTQSANDPRNGYSTILVLYKFETILQSNQAVLLVPCLPRHPVLSQKDRGAKSDVRIDLAGCFADFRDRASFMTFTSGRRLSATAASKPARQRATVFQYPFFIGPKV
jgi:hypothetical protein